MTAEVSARWNEAQRRIYGRVYRFMVLNQRSACHPDQAHLPADQWDTICHNAAWLAAEFIEAGEITFRDMDGEVVATSKDHLH